MGINKLDYYNNPTILSAIKKHTARLRNSCDKEDCQQEIFAELYDFMPLDESGAVKIIERVGRKFRRGVINDAIYYGAGLNDRTDDALDLGDGNYMKLAHYRSADK